MNKAETEENETDEDVNVKAKTEESETDENVNVSNERNLVEEIVTQDEENAKVYHIQECQKKMADAKTKTQIKIKQHIQILQLILKIKMSRSTAVLVDLCSNKKMNLSRNIKTLKKLLITSSQYELQCINCLETRSLC